MKKPDYYKECLISARCSDWDEQEPDTKYIAIIKLRYIEEEEPEAYRDEGGTAKEG